MKHIRIHYHATSVQAEFSNEDYQDLLFALNQGKDVILIPGEQPGTQTIANLKNFSWITVRDVPDA